MSQPMPTNLSTPPAQTSSPSNHRRRQISLEGVLNFTATTPLPTPNQSADALRLYNVILEDARRAEIPLLASISRRPRPASSSPPLIHLFFQHMYEQCPSILGRDNVLLVVLHALFPPPAPHHYDSPTERYPSAILPRARIWLHPSFTPSDRQNVYARLQILSNDLIQGFFAPLKASGGRTPAVSPLITAHSRTEVEPHHGTNTRLSNLRELCLRRDGYRCVILKDLDYATQDEWNQGVPGNGRQFNDEETCVTEVAHIIPHSLNALDQDGTLGEARTYVWRIMNLFDPGVSLLLAGSGIDSPINAITLDNTLHRRFGDLTWYLEPVQNRAHTYTIRSIPRRPIPRRQQPPSTTITFNAAHDTIPPPAPRLLAIHRACCRILSMSGAGECVDRVLRDAGDMVSQGVLSADGSSDLALFWKLREAGMRVVAY